MELQKVKRSTRGRPISFDKNQLIDSVMNKFWEHGYNQVSLSEIARDNGLTRASLYHSFESKEALFIRALNRYLASSPEAKLNDLPTGMSASETLFSLLDEICCAWTAHARRRGCLVINCINELSTNDGFVADHLRELMTERRDRIQALFAKAKAENQLAASCDPEQLSDMLVAFMCGLNTFAKTAQDSQELKTLCTTFLNSLGLFRHTTQQ
jgi:TetR/AcrR family transcriptional repressor of nem operon